MTNNNIKKTVYVGLDDGHYGSKISWREQGKETKYFSIPSRIAFGEVNLANGLHGQDSNLSNIYSYEGIKYTVIDENDKSMHPDIIDLRNVEYPKSIENVILMLHTLKKAGIDDTYNVKLVTGLPFRDYFSSKGSKNEELINEKIKNFERYKSIQCEDPSVKLPTIISHHVLSEGTGAYLNIVMDWNGDDLDNKVSRELDDNPVSFADIGGKTTDIVTFTQGGKTMMINMSNTVEIGVLDLHDAIKNDIRQEFNLKNIVPSKIEQALITKKYSAKGQEFDVSEIINRNKTTFALKLKNDIRKILKSAENIGIIVFVGGGSILIQEELKNLYSNCLFIENAEFSNSFGFLKGAIHIFD